MPSTKDVVLAQVNGLERSLTNLSASQVSELSGLTFKNLRALIADPEGPFANDPTLALKAHIELTKLSQAEIETQRRCVDTLIKAKALQGQPVVPPTNILPDAETPNQESVSNSTFE